MRIPSTSVPPIRPITQSESLFDTRDRDTWQNEMAQALKSPEELVHYLAELEVDDILRENPVAHFLKSCNFRDSAKSFPLLVPKGFVKRMAHRDGMLPMLQQILPTTNELISAPNLKTDPLREQDKMIDSGLIYKYRNRALLILNGVCAVHCRFCFRRNFDYKEMSVGGVNLDTTLAWIKANPQVNEIILSGGDPLRLRDNQIKSIAEALNAMSQLRTLRIHTRTPVVLPDRVSSNLIQSLRAFTRRKVCVLHINHPSEVDAPLRKAMARLAEEGVLLYSQTVLLKGVNDSAAVLARLFEALLDARIQPYYLHFTDPVKGGQHFEVPFDQARRIYGELSASVSGYMLPKFVRETAGMPAKTIVLPLY